MIIKNNNNNNKTNNNNYNKSNNPYKRFYIYSAPKGGRKKTALSLNFIPTEHDIENILLLPNAPKHSFIQDFICAIV